MCPDTHSGMGQGHGFSFCLCDPGIRVKTFPSSSWDDISGDTHLCWIPMGIEKGIGGGGGGSSSATFD